ncbi:MAG TPA: M1 family metallopeptidase [Flavobacteriaceae bacterium]|nr:M1 family metallopeptidase [Flavobacteriaceae bacterium]HPF09948.1 M1 family metallopeptidase [Flavobacteriaceae bacterium]HQU20045.1 M1 family metallopeptidase [Flavobacteriaceae bacterium]HQU63969.1 M1 family metallopeptidase [Flavobacteriaceae bacterium]HRW44455.1 M1 family metallopeptidase [Flavobacteriaceae bacterium]
MKLMNCFWALLFALTSLAQNNTGYWQQEVQYTMSVEMDVQTWQYKGSQELRYTNNSPDTLNHVFYHMYFNAFQPGSEMDVRSRTIADPDTRVGDRIASLSPSEVGYIRPTLLQQEGESISFEMLGTVLKVMLQKPILPGETTTLQMEWEAQVPIQVRRSGRNNDEGVALSMTQWYPKLAEYDFQGWHADPYIGREFYGVWGNFDVTLKIDKSYVVGGTGYLQGEPQLQKNAKTWHFVAPKVHDFTWAADPDFIHDTYPGPDGVTLNFYYQNNPSIIENWKNLQPKTAELMAYYNEHVGLYPYKQYSVIQGGDGGMEYGMCTLITGERKFESLVGVTAHEMAHSWFQFVLATNESLHEWMDEGFTSYISARAENEIMQEGLENPFLGSYRGYRFIALSGQEQPLTTHADRYATNRGYGIAAYSKGCVFLSQLGYVIGQDNLDKTLKRYFKEWAFKHPTPNDFIRVAEKVTGFELDWYLQDWCQTTNTIDYGIKAVSDLENGLLVTLERIGLMPMPMDVYVTYEDGTETSLYIPLQMMWGIKANPFPSLQRKVLNPWTWADPTYSLEIPNGKKVKSITLDKTQLMADINLENNSYTHQ